MTLPSLDPSRDRPGNYPPSALAVVRQLLHGRPEGLSVPELREMTGISRASIYAAVKTLGCIPFYPDGLARSGRRETAATRWSLPG